MESQDDFFQMFSRKLFCPGEQDLLKTRWVHTNPLTERVDELEDRIHNLEERLQDTELQRQRKRPKSNKRV